MSTRRQIVQMSTCRHFRASRRTTLSPTNGPRPQPHSAFERCGRPLPSSPRIIRMLCTLLQRRACRRGEARWNLSRGPVSQPTTQTCHSESRRLSRRVRNLLFAAATHTTLARQCQGVHLILAITKPLTRRVIPNGVARLFLPRSLVRTSRATQSRNLSSIDRAAKLPRVPDPSRIENHSEIVEQTVNRKAARPHQA